MTTLGDHDRDLASAFDGQAAQFERAPVQSNPELLRRLVAFADLPADSLVLDAGCGPGLVARAFLEAGHRVVGVDLSAEMVARAEVRCGEFGDRARFLNGSLFETSLGGPFDASVCRLVLHHAPDPATFLRKMAELVRPGGFVVAFDHTTDPDPDRAAWHNGIERLRDRTHTSCLTPGSLVDLMARGGLGDLRFEEMPLTLDFDEWFDRGTPAAPKDEVRSRLLAGPGSRGFRPSPLAEGAVRIDGWFALVRGERLP